MRLCIKECFWITRLTVITFQDRHPVLRHGIFIRLAVCVDSKKQDPVSKHGMTVKMKIFLRWNNMLLKRSVINLIALFFRIVIPCSDTGSSSGWQNYFSQIIILIFPLIYTNLFYEFKSQSSVCIHFV
jgi:hypothetical protein